MRDGRRITERSELRLDRVAVLWMTLGGIVAMGMVFALGVMVGRRAERLIAPAETAPAPADALTALGEEQALHDKLTFYSKLVEPQRSQAAPPAPPTAAPQSAVQATAAVAAAPAPVAPAATAVGTLGADFAPGPAKPGQYTVQVSSFQTVEEANAFSASLRRKGLEPYVVSAELQKKGTWHRVRVGAFVDADQANAAKERLAAADIAAWVLKAE